MSILFLFWRFVELSFFSLIHGIGLCVRLMQSKWFGRGPTPKVLLGNFITDLFESLGATFIKVGQIMSSRADILPPEVITPLTRLQDRVRPFNIEKVPKIIQESLGQSIEEIFDSFDLVPVSSASVAQVHRACLKNGQEVAVKIRRPGLIRKVKNDLLLLKALCKLLGMIPGMRLVPLSGLSAEFSRSIEQQLDFKLEADNNRRFRENFSGTSNIKIPGLVDDLCTHSVLTMEYLNDLIKVQSIAFTPDELKAMALTGLDALYKMIFIDGFIHCDLHAGNIFFRKGREFVLLDFGLVAKLEGSDLKDFVDFFFGMVTSKGKECARIVYETATARAKNCDRAGFEAAMIELINEHSSKNARDFEVTSFAVKLFDTQRRFGIRGATNFTMTIISLVVYEGIVKQISPDMDFQGVARNFLLTAKSRLWPVG
jgi:ubiquinone biosynthesis protein